MSIEHFDCHIENQLNTKSLVNFNCLEFKHNQTITSHKGSLTKMVLNVEFMFEHQGLISFPSASTSVHRTSLYTYENWKKIKHNQTQSKKTNQSKQLRGLFW